MYLLYNFVIRIFSIKLGIYIQLLRYVQTGVRLVCACINFTFLLQTHVPKWVQHPFKNGTHAPYLTQMGRQSEPGFRDTNFVADTEYLETGCGMKKREIQV